ncbi:dienelactone hydrolase family protein [Luteipulveratus mongoliensis]|uniref:dienelactone hydrolase family protein n=1 Tax=Luteipulveratus mongoliensis TaxID=571913 RepID=UPI00147061E2|nr:dienelactone hydrolase family protein [Luteipulveratus mongoliensis]
MSDLRRETTDLTVPDAPAMRLLSVAPSGAGPFPAVVVIHELFGVNPDIEGVLADFASRGFVAVAPEIYHRGLEAGQWLERDDAGRKAGFDQLNALTRTNVIADLQATLDHLAQRTDVAGAPSIAGFSMGGHIAYLAATALPFAKTVVLYAGWLAGTDIPLSRPEPTLDLTPGITGELLMIVGGADTLVGPEEAATIDAALASSGVPHEVVVLPGVGHAFFWPETPAYDAAAVAESWRRIEGFLGEALP